MKGNRLKNNNEKLPQSEVIRSECGFELRFNFHEKAGDDDRQPSFDYDYIKVSNLTKKAIKTAIIRDKYPDVNDEVALINNMKSGNQSDVDAYNAYQELRKSADKIIQLFYNK